MEASGREFGGVGLGVMGGTSLWSATATMTGQKLPKMSISKGGNGVTRLIPRFISPEYQTPLRYDNPGYDIERIEICAIVVAAIIHES